jgi:hypothetical protein
MNDTPTEMAYLDRAKIWQGLIGWCEEMEGQENEALVGWPGRDPAAMMSSFSGPGGAPALKSPKSGKTKKDHRRDACATYDPKTMSRAVARDLGLI